VTTVNGQDGEREHQKPLKAERPMQTFSVAISVGNIHGEKFEKLEALVDLASDYTTLPREVLERLGVAASGRKTSKFADGRQAESDAGWARLRLEGDDIYARVVFGEQGESTLLGRRYWRTRLTRAEDLHWGRPSVLATSPRCVPAGQLGAPGVPALPRCGDHSHLVLHRQPLL